jgi:hypothetical protein
MTEHHHDATSTGELAPRPAPHPGGAHTSAGGELATTGDALATAGDAKDASAALDGELITEEEYQRTRARRAFAAAVSRLPPQWQTHRPPPDAPVYGSPGEWPGCRSAIRSRWAGAWC